MAFPTPDSEFMPDDSELSSPSAAPSSPLAALTESVRIAPPMTSVANARVPDDTNRYGSIGYDTVVGDGVKFPARKLKPRGATEAGWVLGAEPRPAQSESWQGSFVRPSLPDSAKELPLAPSSAAPFCGGGGGASSSSSSSNNPPRAPARAPPLPDHQRSHHRLAPAPHTGAVHRRGNIYNGQQRGNQSWVPPSPRGSHYGNQHHDERSSYGWHDPQLPGHNLYTGMPLPRLHQPTSPCVPYVYAPQRAQAQPPLSPMDYNGVASGYNAQFVTHPNPYASVPLDTYRMPFNNFQRPQPLTVAPSTISIRAPVDNRKLSLKRQIEYYFSVDNLCKDIFLRGKMDDQGWVPVSLIATFNMVKRVTTSTTEILDALRDSTKLEIQVYFTLIFSPLDSTLISYVS
ncbi:la-related protein 1C-like [Zingiber officinale]|uniref:la-related protein 1C-like n=1 Tax=Zingiber officinale TaxID=94328 RepID=UPI001C4D6278|nr:la-related protein 1C-like [Zingiber officinale]